VQFANMLTAEKLFGGGEALTDTIIAAVIMRQTVRRFSRSYTFPKASARFKPVNAVINVKPEQAGLLGAAAPSADSNHP
jgi:hypothetical protein